MMNTEILKQKKRNKVFDTFGKVDEGILIATDVMARGVDFPDVNWIIQFDPPQDPNFYVHRIGRTARVGKEGNALLLLLEHENTYLNYLQLKNIKITEFDKEVQNDISDEKLKKRY